MVGGQIGGFDFRRSGSELTKQPVQTAVTESSSSSAVITSLLLHHLLFSPLISVSLSCCVIRAVLIIMCDCICAALSGGCSCGSAWVCLCTRAFLITEKSVAFGAATLLLRVQQQSRFELVCMMFCRNVGGLLRVCFLTGGICTNLKQGKRDERGKK